VFVEEVRREDLAVFAALAKLHADAPPGLAAWLRERRPASETALFRTVFGDPGARPREDEPPPPPSVPAPPNGFERPDDDPDAAAAGRTPAVPEAPTVPETPAVPETAATDAVSVGTVEENGALLDLPLLLLRKHTAIFAGSGSGKTVLIRRLVE